MSTNQIDDPKQGPQCACGGATHERQDETGYYFQCEMCGECIELESAHA